MAMSALAAHKLRSALTLLGVLVGVFSIIVVMTAMRVMQSDVEKEMSQLGSQTFMIQKWPAVYFGGPEGFEKYWRLENILMSQGMRVKTKPKLAQSIRLMGALLVIPVKGRDRETDPASLASEETAWSGGPWDF